jgi:hypothetical protein
MNPASAIHKIVSGGQTGADLAALDFALAHGIPHGGWCPKGRKTEAGPLDAKYQLVETPSDNYLQRTEWNVSDSDGTAIISIAANLTGGSKRTTELARKHKKPCVHISKARHGDAAESLRRFIEKHGIKILNVAGSRASKEPEVAAFVREVLERAFCREGYRAQRLVVPPPDGFVSAEPVIRPEASRKVVTPCCSVADPVMRPEASRNMVPPGPWVAVPIILPELSR